MRFFSLAFLLSATLALSACNMTTPSQLKTGDIRVHTDMKTVALSAVQVDGHAVSQIAEDYRTNGRSQPRITMPYIAGQPLSQVAAEKQAADYKRAFAAQGISEVKTDLVAVTDAAYSKTAVVSYNTRQALPPEDCRRITGYQGADTRSDVEKYGMGCEVKTAISRMIVRPDDLLGRDGTEPDDSSRQGAKVQDYKDGKKNEKLDGIQATTIGGG